MFEKEVKAAMSRIINGTAARNSFQYSQSCVTFLFSEWRISDQIIGTAMVSERDFDNVTCVWSSNVYAL